MARVRHKRKPVAEMNVVPYIDVMLVLLVIFMVLSLIHISEPTRLLSISYAVFCL